jgi:hypothetical protein
MLNQRYGLYEPPAIRVQTSGIYAPKAGILGKFGFSTTETAIIHKDIRSFTRRRELIGIFIVPIVFSIVPIFNSLNNVNQGAPAELKMLFGAMIFLFPGPIMAMTLGNMLIGEEGQAVWRIYASPISPKNLVKSKYAFLVFMSVIILIATGIVGILFFQPSIIMTTVAFLEGLFLVFAVGAMGLTFGFKGADFSVTRRARMIRQEWGLISFIACGMAGLGILAPFVPYIIGLFMGSTAATEPLSLIISMVISGIIAIVITAIFHRINLNSASELLRKAEV